MTAELALFSDPVRESREFRAVIEDALDQLDHYATCCFDMCPGPGEPFVHMATCRVCAAVIELRGVLAGEVLFETARERMSAHAVLGEKP